MRRPLVDLGGFQSRAERDPASTEDRGELIWFLDGQGKRIHLEAVLPLTGRDRCAVLGAILEASDPSTSVSRTTAAISLNGIATGSFNRGCSNRRSPFRTTASLGRPIGGFR